MTQSLYERLGGAEALKAAIDLFHEKILADSRVSHFFDDTDMLTLVQHHHIFLATAFGNEDTFIIKSLREAHAHLNLKEEHFTAMLENFQSALQELDIAEELIGEATAIIMSTHDDVLNL